MRLASIDIGTNTVLLLIADVDAEGTVAPLVSEQRIPRLGKGVDAARHLAPDSMQRVVDVLQEYRPMLDGYSPERVAVCATSAVRDAANRAEFLALVKAETGFEVEVMSGDEEARWTYRGAVSGLPHLAEAAVLDIGGGSTELILGDARTPRRSISMDIGAVRLTERFLRSDPPTGDELSAATREVRSHLEQTRSFDARGHTLVAVAGTPTSLAILAQGLPRFSAEAVTNYRLSLERIGELLASLGAMRVAEIRQLSEVMEGRADVIVAGALIMLEIMRMHGLDEAIVSDRGVRYGIVIREWERTLDHRR
jgi:exopolyphosphatase / guanosine-5'-triphosphate,3'-diphosphate pyrophosphatase